MSAIAAASASEAGSAAKKAEIMQKIGKFHHKMPNGMEYAAILIEERNRLW